MECVVLEPNGRHWSINLPPEKAGEPFSKPERDGSETRDGFELPKYKIVSYKGHQFLDGIGNCYWIYARSAR